MTGTDTRATIAVDGLEGHEPIGFLAALGALRGLSCARPSWRVQLFWELSGTWKARIATPATASREEVLDALDEFLAARPGHRALEIGDNIDLDAQRYRQLAEAASTGAHDGSSGRDRSFLEFLAAFASDALAEDTKPLGDTAFRTMRGAGHQHFLKSMRNIASEAKREHIERALFHSWDYGDPLRNLSLRWDPSEESQYALQWGDPSKDSARGKSGNMLGANRLAFEALPLFPVFPVRRRLQTTGFRGRTASDTSLTWPIWTEPVTVDVVRSILAMAELQSESPDRELLFRRGIVEVYRSQRRSTGKFRSFGPAQSVG